MPISVTIPSARCHCWFPPPLNFTKLNTDGAWNSSSGIGGLGVIFRDHLGSSLGGCCLTRLCNSVIECEGFAMVLGMELAISLEHINIIVESDNRVLISLINKKVCEDWRLRPCFDQIMNFIPASPLFHGIGSLDKLTVHLMLRPS